MHNYNNTDNINNDTVDDNNNSGNISFCTTLCVRTDDGDTEDRDILNLHLCARVYVRIYVRGNTQKKRINSNNNGNVGSVPCERTSNIYIYNKACIVCLHVSMDHMH